MNPSRKTVNDPVVVWLIVVCSLIFSMVVIGGITRLTHSGLSIVEWKPITGTLPPLTEEAWQETFQKYQATPEYQQINRGMRLEQFKSIYFWEYVHRLLGRLIGAVFLIPFLIFLFRKKLDPPLTQRLLIAFLLGASQGLMGWLMVKSGLVDNPMVSHYRLAAHLSLTFLIFGTLFWILLDLLLPSSQVKAKPLLIFSWITFIFLCLQIVYGAFTAGLKAGYGTNTFPKMGDHWVPPDFWALAPGWLNFLENHATVQWMHRTLGWLSLILTFGLWRISKKFELNDRQTAAIGLLLYTTLVQFLLGVMTLLMVIPIHLAVLHQAFAFVLFAVLLFVNHSLKPLKI